MTKQQIVQSFGEYLHAVAILRLEGKVSEITAEAMEKDVLDMADKLDILLDVTEYLTNKLLNVLENLPY